MFEFTCPKCEAANRAETVENDGLVGCQKCYHPMRVTAKGGKSPRGNKASWWGSPLVAGFGGIAGLAVASVVVVVGFANTQADPVERLSLHPLKEWSKTVPPSSVAKRGKAPPKPDPVEEPPKPDPVKKPPKVAPAPVDVEKEVTRLVVVLAAPDKDAKIKAVNELKALGPKATKAIPALLVLARTLADAEDVRQAAMEALEKIGAPGRDELPAVTEALKDANPPELRRYAVATLGAVVAKMTDARSALLIVARSDKDVDMREIAITALGGVVGKDRDKVRPDLVGWLEDPMKGVRTKAFAVLVAWGDPEPAQIDFDREKKTLANESAKSESRCYSCRLVMLSERDEIPTLCKALVATTEAGLAETILQVLEIKGSKTKETDQALTRALKHAEPRIQARVAQTLTRIGYHANLFPTFLEAAGRSDRAISDGAIRALKEAGTWSTFDKKESPQLELTKDSLAGLEKALEAENGVARRMAAFALGTMKAEGAAAAPKLRDASKKETQPDPQLEMLTAFARMGPPALAALGDQGEALLDELAEIAKNGGKDQKVCAALALARLAPGSSQSKSALAVLVKAILLKNVAREDDTFQRKSSYAAPMKGVSHTPDPIERELHERAKQALCHGGRAAADALAETCEATFFKTATEKQPDILSDKRHARKTTCEVLTRIGPPADAPSVQKLTKRFSRAISIGLEYPDVIDAFRELETAIRAKGDKK